MTRTLSHNLVKLLAGFAVLFVVEYFASQAWASCGDHVTSGKERAGLRSPKDMPTHVPCSGPMCSQHQESPPIPPAPVPDQDDRGLLSIRFTLTLDPLADRLPTQDLLPLSGPANSIFHPPRSWVR